MTTLRPGPLNAITDVAGVRVGHADDAALASGVTAIVFDAPAIASVDVRGGAPGTRETDLLAPERTIQRVDAVSFSGGSAFGLDAAAGVMAALAEAGRGFAVGHARIPIVPGAILFDLTNGGDKRWGRYPPYRELGFDAASRAAGAAVPLGSAGAGMGARTANLKGGVGSASSVIGEHGVTIGAIAAVNALGSATVGDSAHFWAAPFEIDAEFGALGPALSVEPSDLFATAKPPGGNTTLALVATDAVLTKAEARMMAVMAQDGLARALVPIHTPFDGDVVFAAATERVVIEGDRAAALGLIGHVAALTLARAIARGVFEASRLPFANAQISWCERFGARE